ncbi:MAG: hypothetical protein U0176_05600 [Bacteroidia bacterium]
MKPENSISKSKNVLLINSDSEALPPEVQTLMADFCGVVVRSLAEIQDELRSTKLYFCGDASGLRDLDMPVSIIQEFSSGFEGSANEHHRLISLGKVPVVVQGAGVYFREFFNGKDHFHKIKAEHQFQNLTDSNKPGTAFRKGIYLSEVLREENPEQGEGYRFHLLRCSSNLSGPTDNFRTTDREIVQAINAAAREVFELETALNHVLAQVYENKALTETQGKEKKAKIKAHSDKTKDMAPEGLMAFCTFYDPTQFNHLKPSSTDRFDWVRNGISGLTRLHFRLKEAATDPTLPREFSVTLYPNSVFFVPLSTNRLYTHEIRPSILSVEQIPTRLGYVVRCSNKEALHSGGQTYVNEYGELIPLVPMTHEGMVDLKTKYREENTSVERIVYGPVDFSMNEGDYERPIW